METGETKGLNRVQKIPCPQALPGQCVYCGSAKKDWYLDTNLQYEFYGAVIICNECMNAICVEIGYISPQDLQDLRERLQRVINDNEELRIRNTALDQALNALKVAGYGIPDDSSIDSDSSSSAPELPFSEVHTELVGEGQAEISDGEERSSESSNEPGLADLSTSDDSGEFDFSY